MYRRRMKKLHMRRPTENTSISAYITEFDILFTGWIWRVVSAKTQSSSIFPTNNEVRIYVIKILFLMKTITSPHNNDGRHHWALRSEHCNVFCRSSSAWSGRNSPRSTRYSFHLVNICIFQQDYMQPVGWRFKRSTQSKVFSLVSLPCSFRIS